MLMIMITTTTTTTTTTIIIYRYLVVTGQFANKTWWFGDPTGAFAGTFRLFGFSRDHLGSPITDFVGIGLH